MGCRLDVLMAGAVFAATSCVAEAHHSIAMFDQSHPVELVGTVQEFLFANPHSLIVLQVSGEDARPVIWRLEGLSANSLAWGGWSNKTLKPGDVIRLTVEPLRSGALGGAWSPSKVRFKTGSPIVLTH
jgi:hypothetical protein